MKISLKRIKCILTGGCKFRDAAISECDDKEKTCTITETCCKCGKKVQDCIYLQAIRNSRLR